MKVMVVGAGAGGYKLIHALVGHAELDIVCVVDVNPDAPGFRFALARGIATARNYESAVSSCVESGLDAVLEATGKNSVFEHITAMVPQGTTVISGMALRFFMLLIEDKVALIDKMLKQQTELRLVLNSTHDGMLGINQGGVITLLNAAAARLIGVEAETAQGQYVNDVIPNSRLMDVMESGVAELNQVQEVGETQIVTNRMPVFSDSGESIGAIAVFRDVTELRQLAAEVTDLREIQTLLAAIIQSTQDAISVVDKDGKGLLINPAYTRLTGLPSTQVIGKPANVDIAEGDSMHMQVLETGKPVRNVPMKVGPARKEVIVNVAPLLVNGELRGSVGVIHDISEIKRLTEQLDEANKLIRSLRAKYTFADIVGNSKAMVVAVEQAKRAAQTPATVLLRGESGTGKELFAHAIHNESARKQSSFVRVNCAALSETLLESELFGYEAGAFTGALRQGRRGLFEEASGGTLFLDEIGELSISTQAKLLRALQEQEIVRVGGTTPVSIEVRLIAATHVNLEQAVASGLFREDLYYRLNVIPIVIPPLRYRKEDIEALAMQIMIRHNQVYGRAVERISQSAVASLMDYDWPGNVRELENTIGRAMIHMAYQEVELMAHHLPMLAKRKSEADESSIDSTRPIERLDDILERTERDALRHALKATGGNKTEAARRLGISLRSLYYKLDQLEV